MLWLSPPSIVSSSYPPCSTSLAFLPFFRHAHIIPTRSLLDLLNGMPGTLPLDLRPGILLLLRSQLKYFNPIEVLLGHLNLISPLWSYHPLKIRIVLWNYYVYFCFLGSYLFLFSPHQGTSSSTEGNLSNLPTIMFLHSNSALHNIDAQIFTNWLNAIHS